MVEETDWSQISRNDQWSRIKIENLQGKNPTKIHNALHEVYRDSVVQWWANFFRSGPKKKKKKKKLAGHNDLL